MNEISFRTLGLGPKLLQSVAEAGYTEPTPIQTTAIPNILAGTDRHRHRPDRHRQDGRVRPADPRSCSGKPPASRRRVAARPRADARAGRPDRRSRPHAYGKHLRFRCATVFGGVRRTPADSGALRGGVDIIVATPGRLLDLMQQAPRRLKSVRVRRPRRSRPHARHGLPPDDRASSQRCPRKRQTLLFSATLPAGDRAARARVPHATRRPSQIGRRVESRRDRHAGRSIEVPKHLKLALLVALLARPEIDSRARLHAHQARRRPDRAQARAASASRPRRIHANRSQNQRLRALEASSAARCASSSPPTSPRAASTSTASRTSSTTTSR